MKIVHVITRLLRAGSEENTVATCLGQVARGHDVTIIHGPEWDPTWRGDLPAAIRLIRLDPMVHAISPRQDLKALVDLRRLYRELDADVVHTHQSKAGILGRLAALGPDRPAVVHTVHIAPFLNVGAVQRLVYVAAEKLCARTTDVIVNVSQGMRQACLDHGIGRPDQHRVVRSGMPLAKFRKAAQGAPTCLSAPDWTGPQPPFLVLTLAAFEPRKRQEAFITAMAPHLAADPRLCLVFAGAGAREKDAKALVRELGVGAQTRFLGHYPHPEALIAEADVCVLTSEREGLPRVAVQYLAVGKPVVITEVPGIEEIVAHDRNGVVVGPDDLTAAAQAIAVLAASSDELQRLTEGARRFDSSPWDTEAMTDGLEEVYRDALIRSGWTAPDAAHAQDHAVAA